MDRIKFLPNAIIIFIFSIVALVSSFVLYIYWYIEISSGLEEVVDKFGLDPRQVFESQTVLVIVVLSLLVSLILTGLSMSFIYALKMQQLYRLQNNFINNFTHELKTPVTSLKLYLETFLKHDLSKQDQTKYINYMLQDVHRLSDNISNILDLGRIESRNFQEKFVEQDLVSFVADFYHTNAHLFQGLIIEVVKPVFKTGEEPLVIAMGRSLFEMLLINLATNAQKYNASDQALLTIRFESSGKNVLLRFSDNGIGIATANRHKIFKKFYQINDVSIRSNQGSGLGLYLVQNIVREHHGKITVESAGVGKGTTFVISLPLFSKHSVVSNARKMMGSKQ